MVYATLTKWGNSQGVLIPKSLCNKYGLSVGDKLIIEEGAAGIELKPQRRRFATHPVDLDELFEGWTGTYEPVSYTHLASAAMPATIFMRGSGPHTAR